MGEYPNIIKDVTYFMEKFRNGLVRQKKKEETQELLGNEEKTDCV